MSDTPPPDPRSPPPMSPRSQPEQRSGCATAIMVVIGIILLLPGLCALIFGSMMFTSSGGVPPDVISFIALGLLVGSMGVMLIWLAIRGRRS
jgi:hypothetical protein